MCENIRGIFKNKTFIAIKYDQVNYEQICLKKKEVLEMEKASKMCKILFEICNNFDISVKLHDEIVSRAYFYDEIWVI